MYKVKIVIVGPHKCGKTTISNFLADATESAAGEYQPTQGVRILEFESRNITLGKRNVKADVELWDCSGDFKFENCWPAVRKDAQGIIFVYNPEQRNQDQDLEKLILEFESRNITLGKRNVKADVELWDCSGHQYFTQQSGLKSSQCLTLAYNKSGGTLRSTTRPPSSMSRLQTINTNLDDDGDALHTTFNVYLKQVLQVLSENQKQEEENIIGN